jgi:hypothetical protein
LNKSENVEVDEIVSLKDKLATPKKVSDMKKPKETFFGTKKKRNKSNNSLKSSNRDIMDE